MENTNVPISRCISENDIAELTNFKIEVYNMVKKALTERGVMLVVSEEGIVFNNASSKDRYMMIRAIIRTLDDQVKTQLCKDILNEGIPGFIGLKQ